MNTILNINYYKPCMVGETYIIKAEIININEKTLMERPFWFAASTHSGEEDLCIKTHLSLKEKFKFLGKTKSK